MDRLERTMHARTREDLAGFTAIRMDGASLNEVLVRSQRDLGMLRTWRDHEEFFAAGVPWFIAVFGRDSIIASLQMLAYDPDIAAQTLRLLAAYQGRRVDEWRDEEPGKILHELRVGELANLGDIPHSPYYGSVDATPMATATSTTAPRPARG